MRVCGMRESPRGPSTRGQVRGTVVLLGAPVRVSAGCQVLPWAADRGCRTVSELRLGTSFWGKRTTGRSRGGTQRLDFFLVPRGQAARVLELQLE